MMIPWNDYKEDARSRGALAMEVYVVVSVPEKEINTIREHLPAHLSYQAELEAEGILMFAGPLSDDSGNNMEGTGLIVYMAKDLEEAKALAANDPMHISGAREYSIKRWLINEGSLQLNVKLSAQLVSIQQ